VHIIAKAAISCHVITILHYCRQHRAADIKVGGLIWDTVYFYMVKHYCPCCEGWYITFIDWLRTVILEWACLNIKPCSSSTVTHLCYYLCLYTYVLDDHREGECLVWMFHRPFQWGRWSAGDPDRSQWTASRCLRGCIHPVQGWTSCGWTAAEASRWCSWCTAAQMSWAAVNTAIQLQM